MVPFALKTLQTRDIWRPRCREIAGRHNAITRGRGVTFVGRYRPGAGPAVEDSFFDPRVELDVAPEIETVSYVIYVAEDLGLGAIALGPMPFLLQLI